MKRQADAVDSPIPPKLSFPENGAAPNQEILFPISPPPLYSDRFKTPYVPSKYMANFDSPNPQQFSLPAPIIRYITFQPTEKFYEKITDTCKYFYSSNPIFQFRNLNHVKDAIWTTCNSECPCSRNFNLFNIPAKIWIENGLCIKDELKADSNIASTLIPKLYQCDFKILYLTNQNLTFKEFLFLTKNVLSLVFHHGIIREASGAIVALEKSIENLSKLQNLYYSFNDQASDISSITVKKLVELKQVKDLKYFDLCDIPEIFDFQMFSGFMDKNTQIHFHLCFRSPLSIEYETQVQAYKEKIKNEKYESVDPPEIVFL